MTSYGTAYVESEAILAASKGDVDQVDQLLDRMLPGELAHLERAAELLTARIETPRRGEQSHG